MQKFTETQSKVYQSYFSQLQLFFKRLLPLYSAYLLSRILFYLLNRHMFQGIGLGALMWDCIAGLRFDSFSIVVSNALFIVLSILPIKWFWHARYQIILRYLYLITNSIFLAFNFIDCAYYSFIKKRSTAELFDQLGGQSDMGKLLPQFFKDYWYLVLLWFLFCYLLAYLYKQITIKPNGQAIKNKPLLNYILSLLIAAVSTIGARGGLQRVPIDVVNAGGMVSIENIPIVLNSPFTIIKSYGQKNLEALNYYSEAELNKIYSPYHHFNHAQMQKKNVVVLILESFSKEYTVLGRHYGITPFLDSLMQESLVFSNAFSNGTKSIEGIPAILSSLPSMMPNPFINSIYANNAQTSFASVLGAEGYETAFFHGGINGTMNFTDWSALAGYSHYYGRNEYNNEKDFDGFWGISDEPFLQFSAKKITELKAPFHAAIFTLSSHHPYFVPEKYKNKFKTGPLENSASIAYADYALAKFFDTAKKMPWYNNTVFVLTADHTGISEDPFFTNEVGLSSIPIAFFAPGDTSLKGVYAKSFSQIDILPSVLDYLHYNKAFFAFGNSMNEQQSGFDYMYAGVVAHDLSDSTVYFHINGTCNSAFNYKRDSAFKQPYFGKFPQLDAKKIADYRAFMQVYVQTLNSNSGKLPQ